MRGLGSLNFASKTLRAEARLACSGSLARRSAREADGAGRALASRAGPVLAGSRAGAAGVLSTRSSLRISSGCEISGSLSRVRTGLGSPGASPSPCSSSGSPPGSARARRWASSFAFSAFLSASSSRLMSGRRLVERSDWRFDLARIGFQEELAVRQQAAQAAEIAVDAGIAYHRGAQEDHQLGFLVLVGALREQLPDPRNLAHTRDVVLIVADAVLHQPAEHGDLPAFQPQHRFHLAGLDFRDEISDRAEVWIGILHEPQQAGD